MTRYYCGIGGNDGNSGLTWALRKLTLNGVEDVPVVAGDRAWIGPGAYRELLTCDVSGGNTYAVGTCDVTNGSDQVTGNGTLWVANVAADYYLHVLYYDNGADGVTNGTATFTAAGGNFQAAMIGMPIQINTKGAYLIGAVGGAGTLTLTDPNALGWPAAGAGLTYSIMSCEGHYEIESVDDNTTITLKQPWQGKTLTVLAYLTFNGIVYEADVTGEHTDGIGGVVRITGSDNDQTTTRANAVLGTNRDYRVFRGFSFDLTSTWAVYASPGTHFVIEDCFFQECGRGVGFYGASDVVTVRRCYLIMNGGYGIGFSTSPDRDDTGHVVESCLVLGIISQGIYVDDTGGVTVRNVLVASAVNGVYSNSLTTGQCTFVTNSVLFVNGTGLFASALGFMIEDYNAVYLNTTARTNTGVGANSVAYAPLLVKPILHAGVDQLSGYKFPWKFGGLSEWSQIAAIAGQDERNTDLYGIARPATAAKNSWGPVQFTDMELEDTTVQAGSYARVLHDAGQQLVRRVPCTNVEMTVTLYVRREANYAGSLPQMIIKQPGQSDRLTVSVAAVNTWEQLSDTFTPSALPGFFEVWVESRNTAAAGNYETFYDTMDVS